MANHYLAINKARLVNGQPHLLIATGKGKQEFVTLDAARTMLDEKQIIYAEKDDAFLRQQHSIRE